MGGKFGISRRDGHGPKRKGAIDRLDSCHRRLEERFELLVEHADAVARGVANDDTWDELDELFRQIERTVRRHDADEEESVFPRLAQHPALRPLLDRLRVDHQSQSKQIADLGARLARLKESGTAPRRRFLRLCTQLRSAYLDHIRREDRELLPAVERYISKPDQDAIATEMMDRRGHS